MAGAVDRHLAQVAGHVVGVACVGLGGLDRVELALYRQDGHRHRLVQGRRFRPGQHEVAQRLQGAAGGAGPGQELGVVRGLLGQRFARVRPGPGAQQALQGAAAAQAALGQARDPQARVLQCRPGQGPGPQRAQRERVGGADRDDRRRQVRGQVRQRPGDLAAEPRADDHGALVPQGADHGGQVLGERHQVVARRRPVRAPEAAQVEGRHAVPGLCQGGDDVTPGPPALGEAVHQEGEGAGSGRGLGARQRDMETSAAGGEVAVGPGTGAIDVNRHARSLLVGAPYRRRGRPAPPTSSCTASGAPAGDVLRGWVRVVPGGDSARVGGQEFGPRRRRVSPRVQVCPRRRRMSLSAEGRRRHDCPEPP